MVPALDLVVFSVGLLVALPVCRTPGAAVDPSAEHGLISPIIRLKSRAYNLI